MSAPLVAALSETKPSGGTGMMLQTAAARLAMGLAVAKGSDQPAIPPYSLIEYASGQKLPISA